MAVSNASQTGLVGDSPLARQFEIACRDSQNRWCKWIRPAIPVSSYPIEMSTITSTQYWSLESGRLQGRPVWSFFVAKQTESGEEKYYVFCDPSENRVYLDKDAGYSPRRCYEAMMQPDNSVYLQVLEGESFLYPVLYRGTGRLSTSWQPTSWSIRKSHVQGTEVEIANIPTEIIVAEGVGSKRWITEDLFDYSEIRVAEHVDEQKWLIRTSDSTRHEIVADGTKLQVRNGDDNSVHVETERLSKELEYWTYNLKPDLNIYGAIEISTTQTPPTFVTKSGSSNACDEEGANRSDYLIRVDDVTLAKGWIIDVANFPYMTHGQVHYFPPLKEDKNAGSCS